MTFDEWRELSPSAAAREVLLRVRLRLSEPQQRAVFAHLSDETELTAAFARCDRNSGLAGVPYFLKDLFKVSGEVRRAGSTFLPEVEDRPATDGKVVRILDEQGAVLAGRTHMHEFAYGITGENPHYGDCEHPRFPGRLTGGSSSGSAAVVAAGIAPLAIGSDTGGSIRVPAAFCGLFGFRLTPRDSLITDAFPLAPSYDTAGWFTANAADMMTSVRHILGEPAESGRTRGIYLEMPSLDAEVKQACATAAAKFTEPAGRELADSLQRAFAQSTPAYNTVVADEAWAVHRNWAERYRDRYDPGVWQRLSRVHSVTAGQRATAVATTAAIQRAFFDYFQEYDFLVLPSSPYPAPTKAECTLENRLRLLDLTTPASIAGLPVLNLPVTLPSGLSSGLQIILPTPLSSVTRWILTNSGFRS